MASVEIAQYLYRSEAEIARALLDSSGIRSLVRADDEGGLSPGFFSEFRVVLLVNPEDAVAAREVLGLPPPLLIGAQVREAMLAHARWAYPNEACGLVAGSEKQIAMVFCLTNRLHSRTRYVIDPHEHYGAAKFAERCGLSIVGAWHSHPNGDASISPRDVAESPGGNWITVVIGNHGKRSQAVRAFLADEGAVTELEVIDEATA